MLPADAFFDELRKIATAGDLMTPAVVSDSATVDGPPATPFVKRKGYKKLEQTFPKEAGLLKNVMTWANERTKKLKGKAVAAHDKAGDAIRAPSIKLYQAMPKPVQKAVTDPGLMDASDSRAGAAAQGLKHILKIGSAKERRK